MALSSSTAQVIDALEQYDDAISWINDILTPGEGDESISTDDLAALDQHITQLLTALDLASEDTSLQLERVIDDVSRGVPRLAYDLHFMKDGAATLQSALVDVLQRSKDAVPKETSAALDNLHTLDTIKGRMEAAREVLREAESWSTLENEVTSLISEQSYAKAAERLAEANKSMIVFQNTPEYDPRRTLMVNLQNQLEAALSTALLSAINAQDSESCKRYFSIFSIIQRESEFRNYYYASRRMPVVALWQNASLSDCGLSTMESDQASIPLSEFLPKFYALFLALLNTERVPIISIFPDPTQTLSQLITSSLATLQPTVPQRLVGFSSYYGDTILTHLIDVLRATEDFAVAADKIMEKAKDATNPLLSPRQSTPNKLGHSRRRSGRLSISWRPGQNKPPLSSATTTATDQLDSMEWDQELFQPFIDFQLDYGSLERRYLDWSLVELVRRDNPESTQATDKPRLFRERAIDAFGIAEGSLGRCKAFTHGYGAVSLIQALDGFLESFFNMWIADIRTGVQGPSSLIKTAASDGELSDLDYTAQDWSHIQLSLHLLASARAVFDRLIAFETKLRTFLSQVAAQFRLSLSDPLNSFIAATKGESQLLEQSTLNSAELHSLLLGIETDPTRDPPFSASLRHPSTSAPTMSGGPSEFLLSNARKALSKFAQTCQTSMSNTILSPLRHHLDDYASSATWKTGIYPNGATSSSDLRVPTFSLSPTETMQRVADGLLNLPRLFEVYADDDALAFSLETLPYVESEVVHRLSEQSQEASLQNTHRRRQSMMHLKPSSMDPEVVSSAWLISLGHIFTQYFTSDVLPAIPNLTAGGSNQLASDLDYLSTTLRALNVEHGKLEKWRSYVTLDHDEALRTLNENNAAPLDPILERIIRIRGWR